MRHLWIVSAVVALLGVLTPTGSARSTPSTLAERLGQQCVAEISLSPRLEVTRAQRARQKVEECRLMWHILAAKVDYQQARLLALIPRYNTLWKRPGNRLWILDLSGSLQAPAGWPEWLLWSRFRGHWRAIYGAAQAFVIGPGRHPCPTANHFGGRCDDTSHACDEVPACWERQWCNRPRDWWSQAYWRRPSGRCPTTIPARVAGGQLAFR